MGLFGSFLSKFSRAKASIEDLDEFRRVLIESDLGVNVADQIIETVKREKAENLESAVTETLKSFLSTQDRTISISSGKLTTILIVGVNGTGKTTSAAKLAHHFKANGKKVLLVAAWNRTRSGSIVTVSFFNVSNRSLIRWRKSNWRSVPELNWVLKDLQSRALPSDSRTSFRYRFNCQTANN